ITMLRWPTELDKLVEYCRDRKIKLLEDCALSLFGKGAGLRGDAAIFSLRKSLPVCDGGILTLQDKDDHLDLGKYPKNNEPIKGLLSLVKKWLLRFGGFPSARWQQSSLPNLIPSDGLPPLPASYYWT